MANIEFDCLAVTNVQVFPFKEPESLSMGSIRGLATIVLNDQFQIRGLRIKQGEHGLYVSYPNDPFYKGEEYRSVCNPITRQLREHIENCVLEKYRASLEPKDWVVKFGNGINTTISMDIEVKVYGEVCKEDAIEKAKTLLRDKYGDMVDNLVEMSTEEQK